MNIEKKQRNIKAVLIENIYKRSQDNRSEGREGNRDKERKDQEKREGQSGGTDRQGGRRGGGRGGGGLGGALGGGDSVFVQLQGAPMRHRSGGTEAQSECSSEAAVLSSV